MVIMDAQAQTLPADVDILAELMALKTEVIFMHQELVAIRKLLQTDQIGTPDLANTLDRFAGMWSDFTPEEDAIFKQIAEERSHYFSADPPDITN